MAKKFYVSMAPGKYIRTYPDFDKIGCYVSENGGIEELKL